MLTLSERIEKDLETLEQLKRQRKAEESRGKILKGPLPLEADDETLLQYIYGELFKSFVDNYPMFQQLRVQATEPENQVEFAPVADFLSLLAGETEVVDRLMKEVMKAFA
jgi:hypothetical protein